MAKEDVVLITGASGFIGSAIIRRLAEEYTLVGLDRAGPPDPPAPAHAVDFDLSSDEAVTAGLETVRERFGNRIASTPEPKTISGNGRSNRNSPMNAATASARFNTVSSARPAIRNKACTTIASTAAFTPKNSASTHARVAAMG